MKGASKGLAFYLIPDFKRASEQGFMKLVVAAMNQSFFTLSLGIGAMAIFGSYIGNEKALLGESINVALLDTFVAISAGLIIFPACYSYNVEVNSGPGLIFITLPNIFNDIAFGRVWGSLFFVFMTFAAFSTVLAVFENILACTMDLFGWSRKKACLINCIIVILLSVPCALGFNLWSGLHPLGGTSSILDFEDFLVSNILLPGGSVVFVLFCVSRYGWGWENFVKEANKGDGFKVKEWMQAYMTYVLPILVIAILILGLVKF
jgi:transporter